MTEQRKPTGSIAGLAFAAVCYLLGVASIGVFILFVSDIDLIASINGGTEHPVALAVAINLGLVLLWGVQHSVMARQRFKDMWTRIIPAHTERAFYCLASGVALAAVCLFWAPLGGTLWSLEGPAATAMRVLSALGWVVLLAASFEIDHFELFGLRQPWRALRGEPTPPPNFKQGYLYRLVRHPIQLGVLIGVWFTPTMTASHLMFAAMMTAYIHIGLHFEERALRRELGRRYETYQQLVPKLLPWPRPRHAPLAYNLADPKRRLTLMVRA